MRAERSSLRALSLPSAGALGLAVNETDEAVVAFGEAVVFTLSLTIDPIDMSQRRRSVIFGSRSRPWWSYIQLHVLLDGRTSVLRWPLSPLRHPPPSSIARVDETRSAYVDLVADDAAVRHASPGRFMIRARLRVPRTRIPLDSDPVRLTLEAPITEKLQSLRELERAGHIAFRRGMYDEAERLAQTGLINRPEDVPLLILMGDVMAARRRVADALDFYRRAWENFPRQYPDSLQQPRGLLLKISRLERPPAPERRVRKRGKRGH